MLPGFLPGMGDLEMTPRPLPVLGLLGLILCAGSAFAWTGTLSTADHPDHAGHDGLLVSDAAWSKARLSWRVTLVRPDVYQYEYHLEVRARESISRVLLELTCDDRLKKGFRYPSDDMFDLELWTGTKWAAWTLANEAVRRYTPTGADESSPDLPDVLFGVKSEPARNTTSLRWRFLTCRSPVWGDFCSRGEADGDTRPYLHNAGFTEDDADPTDRPRSGSVSDHVLRPNGMAPPLPFFIPAPAQSSSEPTPTQPPSVPTPELPPAALMGLGMLPLGIAYLRARRRQRG